MARKDKKKKTKSKKPKSKVLKYSPIPPKGKPCVECGNKSGSAFTIPFGYADLLGTQRERGFATNQPVVNVYNYLRDMPDRNMPIKIEGNVVKEIAKAPKFYPSIPYVPLEESPISLEPVRKNVVIGQKPMAPMAPFIGFEDIYNSPFGESGVTTGEAISEISLPPRVQGDQGERGFAVSRRRPNPLLGQRNRRTDVEIVADLMVQQKPDMSYEDAIAAALELSKTKGALKDKKEQLKRGKK